jgi:hypothetical protein
LVEQILAAMHKTAKKVQYKSDRENSLSRAANTLFDARNLKATHRFMVSFEVSVKMSRLHLSSHAADAQKA